MPPWITVLPAFVDEKPLLFNLLQKQLYELSQYTDARVGADGLFAYRSFDAYWSDEQRWPYLIHVGGEVAGFALIHRYPEIPGGRRTDFTMAEFFVMYPWRRQGVGRTAARALTAHHAGTWQLAFSSANLEAVGFWNGIIAGTDTEVERVQVPPVGRSPVGRTVMYFTPAALAGQPTPVDLVEPETASVGKDEVAETTPVNQIPSPTPDPTLSPSPDPTPVVAGEGDSATTVSPTVSGGEESPVGGPAKASQPPDPELPDFSPQRIEELVRTTRTVKFRMVRNHGYALEDVDAFMDQVENLLTTQSPKQEFPVLARLLRESRFHMSQDRGYQVTDVDGFVDQMVLDFTAAPD